MLGNPVVSNSTRKSKNLFGADNQQERLQYSKEVIMKTNIDLLAENKKLRSRVSRLKRGLEVFRHEKKDAEEKSKWWDAARARTKRLYPE